MRWIKYFLLNLPKVEIIQKANFNQASGDFECVKLKGKNYYATK